MNTQNIIKVYVDYVIAYDKYVDRYMVNKREDDAVAEIAVCDKLYAELSDMIMEAVNNDEEMHYDLMDILAKTDFYTKKIQLKDNLKNFFDYLD